MNRTLQLLRATLIAAILAVPARALEWDRKLIEMTPEKGAEVVRARFEYKNTGTKTVQILGVRTSCGCTEATTEASEVAPGASGTVHVLFTIGSRSGLQEKEITLLTSESNQPTRLTLKVQLPDDPVSQKAARESAAKE